MKKDIIGDLFLADDEREEAAQLMGKVNALYNIWQTMPELINDHLVSAVLGFKAAKDTELEQAKEEANRYWEYYKDEEGQRKALEEEIEKLKKKLEALKVA